MTELPTAANIDRNWARDRIIGLEEQVAYYRQVCEQQARTIGKFQQRVAELEAQLKNTYTGEKMDIREWFDSLPDPEETGY